MEKTKEELEEWTKQVRLIWEAPSLTSYLTEKQLKQIQEDYERQANGSVLRRDCNT